MSSFNSGREAALARRRALSAGKAALPPPAERTRTGFRDAGLPASSPASAPALPALAAPAQSALTGRLASMARRRCLSAGKAGAAAPVEIAPAPAVQETGERRARLTASRVAEGHNVTGASRGGSLAVSGTQHINQAAGAGFGEVVKVGQVRAEGGLIVSGTTQRGAVAITGDERGEGKRITGEADPAPGDDLTQRTSHARAGFSRNAGFTGRTGSRQRDVSRAAETTEKGAVITGSAVGRSLSVTGDEAGACRSVSGNQYLTPAARNAACGGEGGQTVSKVAVSATWGGRRVTGIDVAQKADVTGDAPGGADLLTGSQYDAPKGARSAAARRMQAHARLGVTGDAPLAGQGVSGLDKGVARDITGTPYVPTELAGEPAAAGVSSLPTPPRAPRRNPDDPARITGAFAVGVDKVTGNVEFRPLARSARGEGQAAHARLTGEGGANARITGDSWADDARVTGTDGAFASQRNPTERGEKAKAFAGSANFKAKAKHEEAKQLVTGMVGAFNKAGARVTLSGGAQS